MAKLLIPRRRFLLGAAATLFIPAAPAIIRPAAAQLMQTGAGKKPGGGGGGGSVAIVATDHAIDITNASSYTFSGRSFGTASADRKIIVGAVVRNGSPTFSSVTIGGVTATSVIQAVGGTNHRVGLFIADVPTGATGDVVVVPGAAVVRCGIGIWAMTGAASSTASDTDSSTADPISVTLTIPANGAAIGYCAYLQPGGSFGWTNLIESFDEFIENISYHSGACADFTAGGNTVLTADQDAGTDPVGIFATWGP